MGQTPPTTTTTPTSPIALPQQPGTVPSGTTGSGFDLTSLEGFIGTYIPSVGAGIAAWIQANIIDPLKAFFMWLLNLILGIFGLQYDSVKGVTYTPNPASINLPSTQAEVVAYETAVSNVINNPTNIFQFIGSITIRIALAFSAIAARLEPLIAVVTQVANSLQPTALLSTGDLIDGQYKATVTPQFAAQESLYAGISNADYNVLFTNAGYYPSTQEAVTWLFRGYITDAQFEQYAAYNRTTQAVANMQSNALVRAPDPNALIQVQGRQNAAASGFLANTINSAIPASVSALYTYNGIDQRQAAFDWQQHFNIPDPAWFAQAAFRGLLDPSLVPLAAIANNYPPELANNFLTLSQPLIPTRTIATLVANNIITPAQATIYYQEAGYRAADIPVLLAYAATLVKKTPKGPPGDLAKLALSDAITLFNDKAITPAQLTEIYVEHGWSTDAAALALEYLQLKQATTARKQYAEELVDQVALGQITTAQAISQLYSEGYTTEEVLRYQKQMGKAKTKKQTAPTVAEITKMFTANYITAQDVADYFEKQGYTDPYLTGEILLVLNAATTTPTTTAPTPVATPVVAVVPPATPTESIAD